MTQPPVAAPTVRPPLPQPTRKPVVPNNPISVPNPNPTQISSASHLSKAIAEGSIQAQAQQQHLSRQPAQVAQATSGTSPSRTPMHTNGTLRAQPGQILTPVVSRPATTQPPVNSAPQAPATQTSILQQPQPQVSPSQPLNTSMAQQLQHQRSASSGSVPAIQYPVLDSRRIVTHGSSVGKGATQNTTQPAGQPQPNPLVQAPSGPQPQAGAHPSETVSQNLSRKRWVGVVHFQAYDSSKRELKELQALAFARPLMRTLEYVCVCTHLPRVNWEFQGSGSRFVASNSEIPKRILPPWITRRDDDNSKSA